MKGVYGYDVNTKRYFWYIEIMGVEVSSGRGLTRKEMDAVKEKHSMYRWYRDYDFIH
jgi:hypothetical protein